jgi:amino acid adenylation domain-containing protein
MPRLLQDWIAGQARTRPDATAVVSDGSRLTYGELDEASSRLARLLVDGGCRRGDRVVLLMPKSPMAIVGLLGIYKADCIYVPIDPSSPATRVRTILDSCENTWVLSAGPAVRLLEELVHDPRWGARSIGWLERDRPRGDVRVQFTLDDLAAFSGAPVDSRNTPGDPAHILFTSGSTGVPKGVVITHSGVIHVIEWATKYFDMTSSDRVSAHSPLHFDLSFFDIFGAAAVGAEIHVVPPELNVLPNKLADFIRSSGLTQWFSVPSVFKYLAAFDVVRPNDFPALKRAIWAGEVLPTPALIHWMQRLPHVRFTNLYGPTETTIVSSCYTVPECPKDPRAPIPIGAACGGEQLMVLSESRQPVPPGETGELCIGGVGLARGYWRDPERTGASFVPHPQRPAERIYRTGDLAREGDDGQMYFLGRRDSQIKSRGYRIELGEIEAALNAVSGVRDCAVVAVGSAGFEGSTICCAYVPAEGSGLTPARLRRDVRRLIPGYMLPARWLALHALPKIASGKTDRRRLEQAFEEEVHAHAAQTA